MRLHVVVVVALLHVLIACGDDTDTSDPGDQSPTSNTSSPSRNGVPSGEGFIGPATVSITEGVSEPLVFQVPEGTTRVGVMVTGSMDYRFQVCEWFQDGGDVLIDQEENPAICTNCIRNGAGYGAAAAAAPAGLIPLVSGSHSIRVCSDHLDLAMFDEPSGTAEVTIALSSAVAPMTRGRIPVSFHFAAGLPWSADSAVQDPDFNTLVAEAQAIYAAANLELDVRGFYDLGEGIDPSAPLDRWQLAEDLPQEDAIPVVFVTEAALGWYVEGMFEDAGPLLGESRLPGPDRPGFGGALFLSGVIDASNLEQLGVDLPTPVLLGRVLAHELGHNFGLAHSTENEILGNHDTLDDTPEDDPNQLMHWKVGGVELSPSQIAILRSNPWVVYD